MKSPQRKKRAKRILVAPSILAADFSVLGREIKRIEGAGADMIHVDVMDGHFVPNITIGPCVVRDIRKMTSLPLDVHLMIAEPSKYIKPFAEAGSDIITIHAESEKRIAALITKIKSMGKKAGISVKPGTPLGGIKRYLGRLDMVLIMTVEPGFGGQRFIRGMLGKISRLRSFYDGDIEVDGGINKESAGEAVKAGANVLVAGTYVYGAKSARSAIRSLKEYQ